MDQNALAALGGAFILVACVVILVVLVIVVMYLMTLQTALSRVSPHNRLMEPGLVWLSLIPCFNIIWGFFIATRIPDSLKKEFSERNLDDGSDYGKGIALTNAILGVVSIPINAAGAAAPQIKQVTDLINYGIMLVSLILFIIFWVKIAGYSSRLESEGPSGGRRDWDRGFDDDDDGYGRRDDRYGDDDKPKPPPSDGIKEGDAGRYQ